VEIKAVAREPGYRSKIAVESKLEKVDSVGACVGLRGERVKTIVHELNGEKIDIVRYNSNISLFVENALSPAKISSISLNEKDKVLTVSVNDDQFSLAIGKKGQNARLTSKLIGWKIDIKRVGDSLSATEDPKALVEAIAGLTKTVQQSLIDAELTTLEKLEELTLETLISLKGIGEKTAPKILETIQSHVSKEKSKTKLDTIIAEQTKEMKKSQE
jgi:N utilization substance protein A